MVHISYGTGKMENIPSISTNSLSNSFCVCMNKSKDKDVVCRNCYSFYMLNTFRKNMVGCLERNSRELSDSVLGDKDIPVLENVCFVRFNGFGELINDTHLVNLVNICKKNSFTTFALWTKRVDIVKSVFGGIKKPDNLILVFSNSRVDSIRLPFGLFDKTFNVVDKSSRYVNCNGRCIDCLKCYTKNGKIPFNSVIVCKLKKYRKM